jgi:hypothetical protein
MEQNETVYCPSGTHLYKFFLSYYDGDPMTTQYATALTQVLSNAKFP